MAGAGGRPASYTQDALERVVEELEAEGGVVDAQRVKDRLVARGEATPGARLDGMQPRIERHLAEREEARRTAWRRRVPKIMRGEIAEATAGLAATLEVMLGRLHERLEEEALRRVEEVERDKRAHAQRADDLEVEQAETQARLAWPAPNDGSKFYVSGRRSWRPSCSRVTTAAMAPGRRRGPRARGGASRAPSAV